MIKKLLFTCMFVLLTIGMTWAQEKQVTGRVTEAETGEGVPGATVQIKGTTEGVGTDFDGNFSINVPSSKTVLIFTSIGYEDKEVVVGNQSTINAALEVDDKQLEEVVVVGYGEVRKADLTGAISQIKADDILDAPVANVAQAIQGKVPGLQIINTSGRAGSNLQISLRGNGSLSASNEVLYIIDGVPQSSLSGVSANEIESIEVLKDAASAAIYGSRASNGVILVSTKRGKYNQKTVLNFSSKYSISDLIGSQDMLNSADYKKVHDVARDNYLSDVAQGLLPDPGALEVMPTPEHDTDWMGLVLRDKAIFQEYNLNMAGGSENTKFFISGTYNDQEGMIKKDQVKQFLGRLNVDHTMNEYFKIGVQTGIRLREAQPFSDDNSSYQPWAAAIKSKPTETPYDADGNLQKISGSENPLFAFQRKVTSKSTYVNGAFWAELEPIENLKFRSTVSGKIYANRYNRYDAPNTRRGENGDGEPLGYGYYSTGYNRTYNILNTINYSNTFLNEKLRASFLVGQEFLESRFEDSNLSGNNFPSSDLAWLVSAGEINDGRSYYYAQSLYSFFSRAMFGYDDRYNLSMTLRRDGSSKFTKENRWGTFYSVSGAWNIHNESFWNVSFIDELKARASYGTVGNQGGISYATGLALIGSGENYNRKPGLAVTTLFNPDLRWETTKMTNIGFDVSAFDNRLDFTLDLYENNTTDLLYNLSVGHETGFRSIRTNEGESLNQGIEVSANVAVIRNEELQWKIGANFSYNKNEIIDVAGEKDYYTTGFASIVKEGYSMGSFFLLESAGIAQEEHEYKDEEGTLTSTVQPGDIIFVDQNNDGVIDEDDRKVFEGGIAPMFGGIQTLLNYKGFDFGVQGQFSLGKKVYKLYEEKGLSGGAVGAPSYSDNLMKEQLDYWSSKNTGANNPRPHLNSVVSAWNNRRSSRFLQDADYFRISTISLGYNFSKVKIPYVSSLRLFVQGTNLFTFTGFDGIDPEAQYSSGNDKTTAGVDLNAIPSVKSFVVGVNVKF